MLLLSNKVLEILTHVFFCLLLWPGAEMVEENFYAEYIIDMLRCVRDQYHVTVQQLAQALKQTNYSFPGNASIVSSFVFLCFPAIIMTVPTTQFVTRSSFPSLFTMHLFLFIRSDFLLFCLSDALTSVLKSTGTKISACQIMDSLYY